MKFSKKFIFIAGLLFLTAFSVYSQKNSGNCIRIGFWNVENFFDPKKDSLKNDGEFTPEGKYRWTFKRFNEKKNNIYKTIIALGEGNPPAVFGLCEIENDWTLEELCRNTPLSKYQYKYIHYESTDARGIDVGMLYRPNLFSPIESFPIPIVISGDTLKTRDILFVKGIVFGSDTIGIFVNHFPSKLGGATSDQKRNSTAQTLKNEIEKQLAKNPNLPLIIMGDFNDAADSYPVKTILNTASAFSELTGKILFNLMSGKMNAKGSYKYQAQWSFIDQIMVTKNLIQEEKLSVKDQKALVFSPDFLQITDEKYLGTKPFRTYVGIRYIGGFSDHFPVYIDLEKKVHPFDN